MKNKNQVSINLHYVKKFKKLNQSEFVLYYNNVINDWISIIYPIYRKRKLEIYKTVSSELLSVYNNHLLRKVIVLKMINASININLFCLQ